MNKILKNKSGNVILELRQDTGSAWLTIRRSGRLINEQDILDLIDEAGIKTGFEEALEIMRRRGLEKEYDVPFPIAVSHSEQENREVKLSYHFDASTNTERLSQLSLAELAQLSYAQKGDCLASYSDNIFEREGSIYDIFGELITPVQVDDVEAIKLVGENVRYEDNEYIAEATGYPFLDEHQRISIMNFMRIEADSCSADMPIRSPLALEISGDIQNCNIAVANNLTIYGSVKNCSIHCEKDLRVEGTISESRNPGIQVLGSLKVKSISDSRVLVRNDIDFEESIRDSMIACDGSIIGASQDSGITGGVCQAGNNIEIGIAGGTGETEIEIAISPFYRAILMQMTKEMVRLKEEEDENAITDLHARISRCESELDSQLNAFLKRESASKKSVLVSSKVYPKTLFRILKHVYQIKNPQNGIQLIEKD
ncbi:MAG: FapA family protein [Candidatus Cloacimonetes bacterium]|nr:FapA family protein [Candidatus Cloacimonadota bacterium]